MTKAPTKPKETKPICLALQGGGAHGAFTWGVLDFFLEDGRLDVKALSGTSAGAMNAVVYAEGLLDGGPAKARAQLERFWRSASVDGGFSEAGRELFENPFLKMWSGFGGGFTNAITDSLSAVSTPYSFNPLNVNPLKDFLDKEVRFPLLRRKSPVQLFISATNVFTGKIKVFTDKEITAEMAVASACLPTLFQAVTIDGEPYWDGGYTGNPALFPLFDVEGTDDILLVQINPVERHQTPHAPHDIHDRVNEISFNAPLLGELRAIEFVARLIEQGQLSRNDHKHILMHRIGLYDTVKDLDASSKTTTTWDFLTMLKEAGRQGAKAWLDAHFDDIGKQATLDLTAELS